MQKSTGGEYSVISRAFRPSECQLLMFTSEIFSKRTFNDLSSWTGKRNWQCNMLNFKTKLRAVKWMSRRKLTNFPREMTGPLTCVNFTYRVSVIITCKYDQQFFTEFLNFSFFSKTVRFVYFIFVWFPINFRYFFNFLRKGWKHNYVIWRHSRHETCRVVL